jgi:hypothetical protein
MFKLLREMPVIEGPIRIHECHARDEDTATSDYRLERSQLPLSDGTPRRPRMRLCAEVLCDWNGKRRYHRLPGTAVIMDAESTQQLQWLLQGLMAFVRLFHGKYVSGPPESDRPQTAG